MTTGIASCEKCNEAVIFDEPVPKRRKLCPYCRSIVANPDQSKVVPLAAKSNRTYGGFPIEAFDVNCSCGHVLRAEPDEFRRSRKCPKCRNEVCLVGKCILCGQPAEDLCYYWKCYGQYKPRSKAIGSFTYHLVTGEYQRTWSFVCEHCVDKNMTGTLKFRAIISAIVAIVILASLSRPPENVRDEPGLVFKLVFFLIFMAPFAAWNWSAYLRAFRNPDPEHLSMQDEIATTRSNKIRNTIGEEKFEEIISSGIAFPMFATEKMYQEHLAE